MLVVDGRTKLTTTYMLCLMKYKTYIEQVRSRLELGYPGINIEYFISEQNAAIRFFEVLADIKGFTLAIGFNSSSTVIGREDKDDIEVAECDDDNADFTRALRKCGYDLRFLVRRSGYKRLTGRKMFTTSANKNKYEAVLSLNLIPHVQFVDYQIYLPSTMPYGTFVGKVNATLNYYCNYHLNKSKVDIAYSVQRKFYRCGAVFKDGTNDADLDTIFKIYNYAMQDVFLLHELTLVAKPLGPIHAQSNELNTSMGLDLMDTKLTVIYWDIFKNYRECGYLYPYNAHLTNFPQHKGAANFQPEQTADADLKHIMEQICYEMVMAFDVEGFYPS